MPWQTRKKPLSHFKIIFFLNKLKKLFRIQLITDGRDKPIQVQDSYYIRSTKNQRNLTRKQKEIYLKTKMKRSEAKKRALKVVIDCFCIKQRQNDADLFL